MVDNENDTIADDVREERIEDNCTEAVEVIEGAIYENEGCLDNFSIECQRISMINIPDVFLTNIPDVSWNMFLEDASKKAQRGLQRNPLQKVTSEKAL